MERKTRRAILMWPWRKIATTNDRFGKKTFEEQLPPSSIQSHLFRHPQAHGTTDETEPHKQIVLFGAVKI